MWMLGRWQQCAVDDMRSIDAQWTVNNMAYGKTWEEQEKLGESETVLNGGCGARKYNLVTQ